MTKDGHLTFDLRVIFKILQLIRFQCVIANRTFLCSFILDILGKVNHVFYNSYEFCKTPLLWFARIMIITFVSIPLHITFTIFELMLIIGELKHIPYRAFLRIHFRKQIL
jgi:hypothetical protein